MTDPDGPPISRSSTFLESVAHLPHHTQSVPEHLEDEETSSEPCEAITPTSDTHPLSFHHHALSAHEPYKPQIINTPVSPPPIASSKPPPTAVRVPPPSKQPQSEPQSATLKRSMSSKFKTIFRRSNSHSGDSPIKDGFNVRDLATALPSPGNLGTARKPSFSVSANNSPFPSQSVTPATDGSPVSTLGSNGDFANDADLNMLKKQNRSSTGFFKSPKITFNTPNNHKRNNSKNGPHLDDIVELEQQDPFSRPAASGVGLKARRMSVNLPDDFVVDTVELHKEFASASKMPGKRGKFLGSGATSTVKLMVRKGFGNEIYAVKEFRKKSSNENAEEYDKKVKSEYTIAHSLHHPNVVESVRLCSHADRWNVVMEYCAVGELYTLVQKGYMQWEDKICLWKQLLRGVAYLHDHGIAHRDIKLENLLMTEQGQLKISDFGVSEVFSGEHPGFRSSGGECGKNMGDVRKCSPGICGSLPYIAPEVLEKNNDYDPRKLDVWSSAIVMITLFWGGQPWGEASLQQPLYAKFQGSFSKWLEKHPDGVVTTESHPANLGDVFVRMQKPALVVLLLKMLHPVPDMRVSIQDIVSDRWVKTIDCCSNETEEEMLKLQKRMSNFDASNCKAGTIKVKKQHNHLPPKEHRIPQHKFDMGDGYQ